MTGRDIYLEILRIQTNILACQKDYAASVTDEWKNRLSKEIVELNHKFADLMNAEYDLKL